MPQEFSLLGFVAQLHTIDRDLHEVGPAIIARACEMVARQAKRAIGKTHELWPALKPETIARKLRGNTPLLETGEMRDSIEWTVHGLEGAFAGAGLRRRASCPPRTGSRKSQ